MNQPVRYVIFDLDNTLYPKEIGLFRLVDQRINDYMRMKLDINWDRVEGLRLKYMEEYGTTLGGLIAHHNVDPDDYLDFVHDVDLENYLSADPALSELLDRIGVDKIIFTNGCSNHARRVLKILGIGDHFSRIFDIKSLNYLAKPNPVSYQKVLDALQVEGTACIMVEDLVRNVLPAKEFGMTTVLIGQKRIPGVDFIIDDIFGMDSVLQKMGLNPEKDHLDRLK